MRRPHQSALRVAARAAVAAVFLAVPGIAAGAFAAGPDWAGSSGAVAWLIENGVNAPARMVVLEPDGRIEHVPIRPPRFGGFAAERPPVWERSGRFGLVTGFTPQKVALYFVVDRFADDARLDELGDGTLRVAVWAPGGGRLLLAHDGPDPLGVGSVSVGEPADLALAAFKGIVPDCASPFGRVYSDVRWLDDSRVAVTLSCFGSEQRALSITTLATVFPYGQVKVRPLGEALPPLGSGAGRVAPLAWAPDGGAVVYRGFGVEEDEGLFLEDTRTGAIAAVGIAGEDVETVWAPDSTLVAIRRGDRLAIVDRAGEVVATLGATPGTPLAWSPDSTRLAAGALVVGRDGALPGGTNEPPATDVATLVSADTPAVSLAWAPDSSAVAIAGPGAPLLVERDGQDGTALGCGREGRVAPAPQWSADGAWVAMLEADGELACLASRDGTVLPVVGVADAEQGRVARWTGWGPAGARLLGRVLQGEKTVEVVIARPTPDGLDVVRIDPDAAESPRPPADLTLAVAVAPAQPAARGRVTYTFTVVNEGPGVATHVRLKVSLPLGLKVERSSLPGCTFGAAVACELGPIGPGSKLLVAIEASVLAFPGKAGVAAVAGAEPDPVEETNAVGLAALRAPPATVVPVAPTPPVQQGPDAVATPVLAKQALAEPASGRVSVREPGSSEALPLTSDTAIPFGSRVDAREGAIRLTTVDDDGNRQSAVFRGAEFVLTQPAKQRGLTVLTLVGGDFAGCGPRGTAKFVKDYGKPKRALWGKGKGRFRTKGRWASATVRGTHWLTADLCRGTVVRVRSGSVNVRDERAKRTVVVRAGQIYLARR